MIYFSTFFESSISLYYRQCCRYLAIRHYCEIYFNLSPFTTEKALLYSLEFNTITLNPQFQAVLKFNYLRSYHRGFNCLETFADGFQLNK